MRRGTRATRAILIALAVVAAGLVVGHPGNAHASMASDAGPDVRVAPPIASFEWTAVDLRVAVNAEGSRDPDGRLIGYSWDWGDGSPNGTGIRAVHTYAAPGTYAIALTVSDDEILTASVSRQVILVVLPTADFDADHDGLIVGFNATASTSANGAITEYTWDFGDGQTGTGPVVSHTYGSEGQYNVTLGVTDVLGRTGLYSRQVSPAATTVDVRLDAFFEANCPFREHWLLREDTYGDVILANGPTCAEYTPWVLYSYASQYRTVNPSWIHALYRMNAAVRNHPGFTVADPVFLPVFNASVAPDPASYVRLDLTFDYLDSMLLSTYRGPPYYVSPKYSDGFGYLVRGNITMDLVSSKRIFGVKGANPTEAQLWWWNYTGEGTGTSPRSPGPLEANLALWLELNGNVKYDIYNAFEWFYEADLTYLNATVDPDGTTRVQIFWDGWGYDVLLARWFYWGKASYRDAVCVQGTRPDCTVTQPYGAVSPGGWMPMELPSFETATITGVLGTALDLDFRGIVGYHFRASADAGADTSTGTTDDLPAWLFEPILADYVPRLGSGSVGEGGYGNSELRFYEGRARIHDTPGSYSYGSPYEYLEPPTYWNLGMGSSLTLRLPRTGVPWYDPARSSWNPVAVAPDLVRYDAPLTLRAVSPDIGLTVWNERTKTLSIAGTPQWDTSTLPLAGVPSFSFAPETIPSPPVPPEPQLEPFEHAAGFALLVPVNWTKLVNQTAGNETLDLLLLGPIVGGIQTNIIVDVSVDLTAQETPEYLFAESNRTLAEIRRTNPTAYFSRGPAIRTTANRTAVDFVIGYESSSLVQRVTALVDEPLRRAWVLVLTVDGSAFPLENRTFGRMVSSFAITLEPPPEPPAAWPLLWTVAAAGIGAAAIVASVAFAFVLRRRSRPKAGPPPMQPSTPPTMPPPGPPP